MRRVKHNPISKEQTHSCCGRLSEDLSWCWWGGFSYVAFCVFLFWLGSTVWGQSVAYWRFDDVDDAEIDVPLGTVTAGNALPDSDGQTVWRKAAHDHSGNGNHLTTWEHAWAGHNWSDDVPAARILTQGLDNALSAQSAGNWPAMMTWSEQSLPAGVDLETWTPEAFTVEASFKMTDISGYHTIVGRDGTEVFGDEAALAPFYLSVRHGTGTLGVVMVDMDGVRYIVESEAGFIQTNQWYNAAVVCDGQTLSLYCDNELINSLDMTALGSDDTRLAMGSTSGGDWESGTWTVGRGLYNGGHVDRVYGWVDEIRLTEGALDPEEFLFGQPALQAKNPFPVDGEADASYWVQLHWTAGEGADRHDLHLGASLEEVQDSDTPLLADLEVNGVELGRLNLGQTYFWRVDEVNQAEGRVEIGPVWSFTVEPEVYGVDADVMTVTASSTAEGSDPRRTVDGLGLNEQDEHSTQESQMWFSSGQGPEPVWIQYVFDQAYPLHEIEIWNSNHPLEMYLGYGLKEVLIEVTLDGNDWVVFDPNVTLEAATGLAPTPVTSVIDLGGLEVQGVRVTALSSWTSLPGMIQMGLSEVRFSWIPLTARVPQPADGAVDVPVTRMLSWRPGREAAVHEVLISTDVNAIVDGNAWMAQVERPELELLDETFVYGQTYFWRVDEVNEDAEVTRREGDLWSFSTPPYVVVDDMESYDDVTFIYEAWADGYGIDENGSQVGHDDSPYVEQVISHSGSQSMPYTYVTTEDVNATAVRNMGHADWSQGGLEFLTMAVLGGRENVGGQLFVEINGQRADCPLDLSIPVWTTWSIDLMTLNLDLNDIETMVIGVEGVGHGLLYLDDIRLYHEPPAAVEPVDPGTDGLILWYEMEGDLTDSAGVYDGNSITEPEFVESLPDLGSALDFDGFEDVVEMPIGELVAGLTDSTFAAWVNLAEGEGLWQRVFDVGTGTDNYLFLCPRIGTEGPARVAILTPDSGGEILVTDNNPLSEGWHHLAVVFGDDLLRLYVDGQEVGQATTTIYPRDLGVTTQNWVGDSQWDGDSLLEGLLDEFRLYGRALLEGEVRFLAGDR